MYKGQRKFVAQAQLSAGALRREFPGFPSALGCFLIADAEVSFVRRRRDPKAGGTLGYGHGVPLWGSFSWLRPSAATCSDCGLLQASLPGSFKIEGAPWGTWWTKTQCETKFLFLFSGAEKGTDGVKRVVWQGHVSAFRQTWTNCVTYVYM